MVDRVEGEGRFQSLVGRDFDDNARFWRQYQPSGRQESHRIIDMAENVLRHHEVERGVMVTDILCGGVVPEVWEDNIFWSADCWGWIDAENIPPTALESGEKCSVIRGDVENAPPPSAPRSFARSQISRSPGTCVKLLLKLGQIPAVITPRTGGTSAEAIASEQRRWIDHFGKLAQSAYGTFCEPKRGRQARSPRLPKVMLNRVGTTGG